MADGRHFYTIKRDISATNPTIMMPFDAVMNNGTHNLTSLEKFQHLKIQHGN